MRICLLMIPLLSLVTRADLASLETLTGEWIDLRTERAREAEAWKGEEARLRMELRLLEDAEAHLQEELTSLQTRESETENQQADLIGELERRQTLQNTLTPRVQSHLTAVLESTASLPPPLLRRLEEERAATEAAGADLLPRVRALLGLLNQWTLLQTSIQDASMVLEQTDGRREMEVLWIGTAKAYAVNTESTLAAVGTATPDGWQWSEANALAPRIRQALRIYRQETPPALIRLPVEGQQ